MKYHVIVIKYNKDETIKKSVYDYNTANEAKASFHRYLGSDMSNADLLGGVCTVLQSDGGILVSESWTAEQAQAVIVEE